MEFPTSLAFRFEEFHCGNQKGGSTDAHLEESLEL